jgi:hypothetical protein
MTIGWFMSAAAAAVAAVEDQAGRHLPAKRLSAPAAARPVAKLRCTLAAVAMNVLVVVVVVVHITPCRLTRWQH